MIPNAKKRATYTRTASGKYLSRRTNPLDPSGPRLELVGATAHELAERQELIDRYVQERRLDLISESELAKKLRGLQRRAPALVRPIWDAYLAAAPPHYRSKLRSVWRCQLAPWFDGELVVDQSPAKMARWERALMKPRPGLPRGYAPKTVHDSFTHLGAALRSAIPDLLEELPWKLPNGRMWKPSRSSKRPRDERPACGTLGELEALVSAALVVDKEKRARGIFADAAHRIAVVTLLALRNGEGSGLAWDDLTLEGKRPRARIRHQALDQWRTHFPGDTRPLAPPKGGRERSVELTHPTAIAALVAQRELLERRGWYRADGPVFPCTAGRFAGQWRPNANCIRPSDFKELARLAGLPDWKAWVPHSLRHSAATLEHDAGASMRSIQGRTGHGSLRVLEGYIHARTGSALVPSAIRALAVSFDDDDGGDDG